ncbi:hypothetical protein JTB14_022332 [Gonioctena quinquepunctata]|nr:hypothetical protein JTB14_022332 [Gonioctena quinquepunctata]
MQNKKPQGSTLSEILFAIAEDDLSKLYVDDLVIYHSGESVRLIEQTSQEAIDTLTEISESQGFRFSPTKTRYLHICILGKPQLHIEETVLEHNETIEFLGLTFDRKLTWTPHIQQLAIKCKESLNIIRCSSNYKWGADRETLMGLQNALIFSKMDYGCMIYSFSRNYQLLTLDSIQCAGLRASAFCTTSLK